MINKKKAMDSFIRELEALSRQGMTEEELAEQDSGIKYYEALYQNDVRGLAVAFVVLQDCIRKKIKEDANRKEAIIDFFLKAGRC